MKIRITGQQGEPIMKYTKDSPWAIFFDRLLEKKFEIISEPYGQNIDALVCNGYSKKAILEAKKSQTPKDKLILILWEPPVTNPRLHSEHYLDNFGHIFSPSKTWASKHPAIYFNWPVGEFSNLECDRYFLDRLNSAVLVQSNKVALFAGENYSLRRKLLFQSIKSAHPIHLYGYGWDKIPILKLIKVLILFATNPKQKTSIQSMKYLFKRYPFYLGVDDDKSHALKKYRFSIVIENHSSYVSEKLFDSLNAGCVTLYVGPSLEQYGLSSNTAIQVKQNANSILQVLAQLYDLRQDKIMEIQKSQQEQFRIQFREWNNRLILRSLGEQILRTLV